MRPTVVWWDDGIIAIIVVVIVIAVACRSLTRHPSSPSRETKTATQRVYPLPRWLFAVACGSTAAARSSVVGMKKWARSFPARSCLITPTPLAMWQSTALYLFRNELRFTIKLWFFLT